MTAAVILGVLLVLGIIAIILRDRRLYGHHKEIAADARIIAKEIGGQVFRDHEDLVISGGAGGLRVVVRFGYGENTPGVNIRMDAPATFQMSLALKSKDQLAGRARVLTGDTAFDARFAVRSDDPKQAEMFLGSPVTMSELASLCCSSIAFVTINKGVMEQSELTIPDSPGRHVVNHIRSMQKLAGKLRQMPLAERVVLSPVVHERPVLLWSVIFIGVVAAGLALYSVSGQPNQQTASAASTEAPLPVGIQVNDADLISSVQNWKPVSDTDLDPDALRWVRAAGKKPAARVEGDFSGEDNKLDVAYLLRDDQGQKRLIIISKRKVAYDTKYDFIGVLARIPKENLKKVEWASRKPETPDGDAVLFTRTPHDLTSGLIMYFSDGKLVSGVPKNYQAVDLTE